MNEKMRSCVMGLLLGQFSSPLPMAQKEPVAYLYNGVRLPKLPEWDREKYPFVVVMQEVSSSIYFAQAIAAPLYTEETVSLAGKSLFQLAYDQSYLLKSAIQETGTWGDWYEVPKAYFQGRLENDGATENVLVWTNHDILNQDGTVYLAASEPVPVYE